MHKFDDMKLGINQPYFFPYIGFYQLVNAVDKFIIYDNQQYIRHGWINRNRYLVVNGEPTYMIAPVENDGSTKKIKDIKLANLKNWRKKLLNALFLNYKKSLFFQEIYGLLEEIILYDTDSLSKLCSKSIIDISRYLGIQSELIETPNYEALEQSLECENLQEVFPDIKLNAPEKKTFRIIRICQNLKADGYVNAIGGQKLYDKAEFEENGIDLHFLQSIDRSYQQNSATYHPHLSIIDVLMNCGRSGTAELLNSCELI
jgi:hypothetical protein